MPHLREHTGRESAAADYRLQKRRCLCCLVVTTSSPDFRVVDFSSPHSLVFYSSSSVLGPFSWDFSVTPGDGKGGSGEEVLGSSWDVPMAIWDVSVSRPKYCFVLFLRFFFFWCGPFLKSLFDFVTILLLASVLAFWPPGMCNLSSLIRDGTCAACTGSLNHLTSREVPTSQIFHSVSKLGRGRWYLWRRVTVYWQLWEKLSFTSRLVWNEIRALCSNIGT